MALKTAQAVSQPVQQLVQARSQQLDILKAFAIIFVVAFHYFPGQLGWHMHVMPTGWFEHYWVQRDASILQFLESYLYVGVNIFVIASGFGLYLSHVKSGKPLDLREFFVKRVWRLMPAAILSITIVFLVKGIFLDNWATGNFYLNFLPFLGGLNLFSDNWFFAPINGETWFLGLILQLYLFFPLLVWLSEKVGRRKFLLLLFVVSVLFRALYFIFWKDVVSSLSYGLSIGRLFEFGFGMMLAKDFLNGKKLSPWWILVAVGGLGYFWAVSFPFADGLFGVGVFAALWFVAEKFPQFDSRDTSLRSRLWVKIASLSYLIFLLHHPFIWIVEAAGFHDEWSFLGLVMFFGLFIFSCGLAQLSQWILDKITALRSKPVSR